MKAPSDFFQLVTLTPNPALDVSGIVDDLVPNEKNYVHDERRDPGGNGINAARIASRLQRISRPAEKRIPVTALGFLGGDSGSEISALLEHEGVRTQFTPIAEKTRVNITVSNARTHQQTRLAFPGPRISKSESAKILHQAQSLHGPGLLILGGSLPPGIPASFHAQMGELAQKNGWGVVLDAPAPLLKSTLRRLHPLLIKPNDAELSELVGAPLKNQTALIRAARELTAQSFLVCVSRGKAGAILAIRGVKAVWVLSPPRIEAKGTVGAGDSLVGATCFRLCQRGLTSPEAIQRLTPSQLESSVIDAFRWGIAAGAATASTPGTSLAPAARIRDLVAQVRVARSSVGC